MKTKVLIDLRVEIDPPAHVTRWLLVPHRDLQKRLLAEEKALNEWARDFEEFVRDHRSQDAASINVVRLHETRCSHCAMTWEEDPETGEPQCCGAAQEEWLAEVFSKAREGESS